MPEDVQRQAFRFEYLRLLAHHLPADLPAHETLEAGLDLAQHA